MMVIVIMMLMMATNTPETKSTIPTDNGGHKSEQKIYDGNGKHNFINDDRQLR